MTKKLNLSRNTLLFFLPILMLVKINLIGNLFLCEVLILLCFALVLFNYKIYQKKIFLIFFSLYFFYTWGLFVSDIVNNSSFIDYSRGWAKQFFTFINILFFYFLFEKNKKNVDPLLLGFGVFYIIHAFLDSNNFSVFSVFIKFGGLFGLYVVIVLILKKYFKSTFFFILVHGVNVLFFILSVLFVARSIAGIFILLTLLLWIIRFQKKKYKVPILKIFLYSFFVLISILYSFNFLSINNFFGDDARNKFEEQYVEGFGPFGLIIGGRTEFIIAFEAIKNSPFLGHGSWASDYALTQKFYDLKKELNVPHSPQVFGDIYNKIPSHSHLTSAWIEAGFLGFVFWLFILFSIAKILKYILYIDNKNIVYLPIILLLCLWSTWDILFSPYGGERRFFWGFTIALLFYFLNKLRHISISSEGLKNGK